MSSARSLGPYELREEVARGRSGSVHLAWDSCDEREVAVHLLSFSDLGPKLRRRFEVESQALMQLDHPHLVHVLDAGLDQDGTPYLVRETVEGPTLEDVVDMEGCLPPEHAVELIAKVADALQAAHDADLLHRDLTPSSVILDEAGEPRLTDFGLVRELSGDATAIRLKGRFLGTAGYLAPEQARAEPDGLSVRTDVHGLGAILFALLTGEPPSSARTLIEAVDALHAPPPAPSSRRADLPADLDAIVLRCLAKDDRQRFPTAADLATALRAWSAEPAPEPEPVAATGKALMGWLLVLLVLSPAAWGVGRWRLQRARQLVAEREQANRQDATQLPARLGDLLGRIPEHPLEVAREAEALAERETQSAQAWSVAALAALHAGRADEAEQAFSRALALDPERLGDRLARAHLFARRGADSATAQDALAVLALWPDHRDGLELAARAALALNEPARARDHAARITALYATDPTGWELLARARLALDDLKGALGAATRLRQIDPHAGEALLERIGQRR